MLFCSYQKTTCQKQKEESQHKAAQAKSPSYPSTYIVCTRMQLALQLVALIWPHQSKTISIEWRRPVGTEKFQIIAKQQTKVVGQMCNEEMNIKIHSPVRKPTHLPNDGLGSSICCIHSNPRLHCKSGEGQSSWPVRKQPSVVKVHRAAANKRAQQSTRWQCQFCYSCAHTHKMNENYQSLTRARISTHLSHTRCRRSKFPQRSRRCHRKLFRRHSRCTLLLRSLDYFPSRF